MGERAAALPGGRASEMDGLYRIGGLLVWTDTTDDPLFERGHRGVPDVVIRKVDEHELGEERSVAPEARSYGELVVAPRGEGGHFVRWPEWFDAVVTPDAREIRFHDRTYWPGLSRVLLGGLLPMTAAAHGRAVVHGSAVDLGGASVVVVGDKGAGKSTMATALCLLGGRLLADDLTFFRQQNGEVVVEPSSVVTRLFPEVAAQLGAAGGDPLAEKRLLGAPWVLGSAGARPVRRVYHLERDDEADERPLRGGEAAVLLLRHMFADIDRSPRSQALRLTLATKAAEQAEVTAIRWQPGPTNALRAGEAIVADLRGELARGPELAS